MIQVSPGCYIPHKDIVYVGTFRNSAGKKLVKRAQEENKVINISGNNETRSVVLLHDGWVCRSPVAPETLTKRILDAQKSK